jgi:AcrR family transcriptional regulator
MTTREPVGTLHPVHLVKVGKDEAMTKPDKATRRATVAQMKMVDAAMDLISEGGLALATLARVGERAGYSRGLADYHFGSKSELVEQVVHVIAETWTGSLVERGLPAMRGIEALAALVDTYLERLSEDPRYNQVLYILAGESVTVTPEIRAKVARHDESFRRLIRRWVIEAQVDGALRPDVDPVKASVLIEGLLRGVCMQWLLAPTAFAPTDMTSYILDAIVGGLGSPSGVVQALRRRPAPVQDPEDSARDDSAVRSDGTKALAKAAPRPKTARTNGQPPPRPPDKHQP